MTLSGRLRAALARPYAPASLRGSDLDPEDIVLDSGGWRPAAVLIAVTDQPEPGVILTQRTEHLSNHAGQVAFPGGRAEADDTDAIATALREAEEEIGLDPCAADVIGTADRYRTATGFDIVPVLAVVPPAPTLRPDPNEVAAVFEVPFAYLLDLGNHLDRQAMWRGRERRYSEILFGERRIWGATAAILANLSRRLQWN